MSAQISLFDRISHRYDLMNRIISFGRDMSWRRALAGRLGGGAQIHRVLDIAAGTGDQMILISRLPGVKQIVGIDTSDAMIAIAGRKLAACRNNVTAVLITGDSHRLPFPDAIFDAVTVTFGIRNFHDRPRALAEMRRVLAPGGHILILELTVPENRLILPLYHFYTRLVVPLLGSLIAGDYDAYRYLHRSVDAFPPPGIFIGMMAAAGFGNITATPLTSGAATLFEGVSS